MAVYLGDDEVGVCVKEEIIIPPHIGEFHVTVIDYDGTVLKEAYVDNGDEFELPSSPTHTGMTFQGWSSPVTITNNKITVSNSNITIMPTYTTSSGLSEFDIELTPVTGLTVNLKMSGTKNWGDGTSNTTQSHTYSNYGKYTIKCNGTLSTSLSSSAGIFSQGSSSVNYYCKAIRLAGSSQVASYAFQYCYGLKSITFASTIRSFNTSCFNSCVSLKAIAITPLTTSIAMSMFQNCSSLEHVALPTSVTSISASAFHNCAALKTFTIPANVTSLGSNSFENCASLDSIVIPSSVVNLPSSIFNVCSNLSSVVLSDGVKTIGTSAFNSCKNLKQLVLSNQLTTINSNAIYFCYNLRTLKFPATLTTIASSGLAYNYCMEIYDFTDATAIPTLSNTNAFTQISATTKIVVPDALYTDWIAANNWSTYANYIYKASEVTL